MANLNKISIFATSNSTPHNIFYKNHKLVHLSNEKCVRSVWRKSKNHIHYICTTSSN